MVGTLIGRDRDEVARRADALLAEFGEEGKSGLDWLQSRRSRWIMGTPDEARAMVERYAEAGIERLMLQDFLPHDLEHIDLMARELIGKV
jgi:alkanesulfonate monooxygenase SsuD/methylene tetrahydromethanopterin reductase-like flavin-dependent oxidoreductase (luciferase family)